MSCTTSQQYKGAVDTHINLEEAPEKYTEGKKAVPKGYILYDTIYKTCSLK
jgi:hypothetical protein